MEFEYDLALPFDVAVCVFASIPVLQTSLSLARLPTHDLIALNLCSPIYLTFPLPLEIPLSLAAVFHLAPQKVFFVCT